ncbi:IS1595 family transposase [Flavobacterium microcysteis]|uniref:IS1595 family transposase n=1 Tax=Flavobacterium microcysteis TaxID=2596891 RepID=A0A501QGQ7_9FLAO|nr:IS1595 family transposase [Flavobacterium microcysteis]TPD71096.1 IS1595 family transposase [Flavobacterium microcysteis]
MVFDTNIKSMFDLQKAFPNEQACIDYLEHIIWAGTPVSPFDSESKVYKCADNQYKCCNTGKRFNIKTGTFLENTKLPLQKWLLCIWILTIANKGVSSIQLSKMLGITQKSAWFMAHRVRAVFGIENYNELEGEIEIDESYFSGKNKNRHAKNKIPNSQGRAINCKTTPVFGMVQRGGKLNAFVVSNVKKDSLQPIIRRFVKSNTRVISDEWVSYSGLNSQYNHDIVNHGRKEYVNLDDNTMHTNTIEGVWGIMKRSYNGIYNWWSKKHMQKYVDEFVYRYNMRKHPDSDKFNWLLANAGVSRTKYKDLIK